MPAMRPFDLQIVDVFCFEDGRTVFVGPMTHSPPFVGRGRCEIVANGETKSELEIEGEMIPDRPHPLGYRSISTTQSLDLDLADLRRGVYHLRGAGAAPQIAVTPPSS